MASSTSGVWNGEAKPRSILRSLRSFGKPGGFAPAVVLAVALIVLALYRLRLRQLTRQLNVRFEERLGERTRIAQELHDTLLQGFLSASMQLHVAVDRLPAESPAQIVVEPGAATHEPGDRRGPERGARSAIVPEDASTNLEQAFARVQQELAVADDVGFRVIVEGQPRPLHPVLRDEVYRIGREALVNAFRHPRARVSNRG